MALRLMAGRVTAALALAAVAACGGVHDLRVPSEPGNNAGFMVRYAALGNSITGGVQSGGINDSTQRRSYPALIARAVGTRMAIPSLTGQACAPLPSAILAFRGAIGDQTIRPPGATCARISQTDQLNDVGVWGARLADAIGAAGATPNPFTTLVLGGRTQVQRALEIDPTFVSVWFGNNDVLAAALAGDTTSATALSAFTSTYDQVIAELTAGTTTDSRRGILIGVIDVAMSAALFPAAAIVNDIGGFRTGVEQALLGGRKFQIVNCPASISSTALVSLGYLLQAAQSTASTIPFACTPTTIPLPTGGTTTIGTAGILDPAEVAGLRARVAGYNNYVQQKAQALGWAYWDPNPLLLQLKATGAVSTIPNLASTTAPFGSAVSFDGIHPSSAGQLGIANALIDAINAKYGSSIPDATAP